MIKDLNNWLKHEEPQFIEALTTEIKQHVLDIGLDAFYGYSILPGNYYTMSDPATIAIAFNREKDIRPENRGDVYYRYSVDEWENYVYDGFDNSISKLKEMYDLFKSTYTPDPNNFEADKYEIAFVTKIHKAILKAFIKLKEEKLFKEDTYLIIWFSDSEDDIVEESAKTLNTDKVYKELVEEFL